MEDHRVFQSLGVEESEMWWTPGGQRSLQGAEAELIRDPIDDGAAIFGQLLVLWQRGVPPTNPMLGV